MISASAHLRSTCERCRPLRDRALRAEPDLGEAPRRVARSEARTAREAHGVVHDDLEATEDRQSL